MNRIFKAQLEHSLFKILLGVIVLLSALTPVSSYSDVLNDEIPANLESAFIFQFTRFVTWPESHGNFEIVVLENNELASHISRLAQGQLVGSRPIEVKEQLKSGSTPQILILPNGVKPQTLNLLKGWTTDKEIYKPTLIICAGKNLGEAGATINFYIENDRLKFEINIASAETRKLKFSSQLLRLGRIVNFNDNIVRSLKGDQP